MQTRYKLSNCTRLILSFTIISLCINNILQSIRYPNIKLKINNYGIIAPGRRIGSWPVEKLPNGSLILCCQKPFFYHLNYWILMVVVMTTKFSWLTSVIISFGLFN